MDSKLYAINMNYVWPRQIRQDFNFSHLTNAVSGAFFAYLSFRLWSWIFTGTPGSRHTPYPGHSGRRV
jgi:hypothetical protein